MRLLRHWFPALLIAAACTPALDWREYRPPEGRFTVLFPLTFLSNAFVPTQTLPGFLRPIAEWNPVSALTAAARKLWGNPNPYAADGFPAEQPELLTLIWIAVMLVVFVPLAIRKYRSISR